MSKQHTETKRNSEKENEQELAKQIEKLLEERGAETFEKVRESLLEEKIECQEIQDALKHFLSYKRMGFLVRSALVSLGCEAVNGSAKIVPDVAAPLVLMSGGMDIHDDIIDESKKQGSSTTVLGEFNKDIALLTGDALLFKGLISWSRLTEKLPTDKFLAMCDILKQAFFEVGDGEALELRLRKRTDVKPEQYIHIVRKKAADIGALLRIGAALGSGSKKENEVLGRFGRCLGMLWILGDDLTDMFDHKEMALRANKGCLPLPVLCALNDVKAKAKLHSILSKPRITQRDAKAVLDLVREGQGFKQTKALIEDISLDATRQIEGLKETIKLKLLLQASVAIISQI
jgi:geranylgeranyl pyrophosphate synthase